jgi:hypothetical protein
MGKYIHPNIPACPVIEYPDEWFQDVGSDLGWLPAQAAVPVATMTVAQVVEAVGDDPAAAAAALAAERADRDRVTLTDQLAVTATHPVDVE